MNNKKNNKPAIWIAILFEIIIIITAILNVLSKQWTTFYLSLVAIICIILPFIINHIANAKKLILPPSFLYATLIFLFLSLYFGEIQKFYTTFWWWDLFLHGIFGIYAVLIGLCLMRGIISRDNTSTEKRYIIFTIILAFCFSIALGTLWEMFEFLADYFFKADMVNGGLEDTASDLLIKIFCAFSTSIICYHRKLKKKI